MAVAKRIVFLGPPNSGKGTQAATLAEALDIPAISTGDMLRASIAAGSELGRRVEGVLAAGELVNDELMADLVRERLAQDDAADGFLLDGYPRTLAQVETLDGILNDAGVGLDHVVLIDAPVEVLVTRALNRGRADDDEAIVRERLRQYDEKTRPLVDHYSGRDLLRRIDGDASIEDVGAAVRRSVGLDG